MSMVTSCPSCTTTFRVTQDQLKQRQGKVRCGKCAGVFDAFKTLATLPDAPLSEGAEAVPGPRARAAPVEDTQGSLDIDAAAARPFAGAPLASGPSRAQRRERLLWLLAVIVLAGLLLLQLAYALRDPLAAALPAARPLLERLCAAAGCTVSLPRRTDLLAIEASDLQADPARANVIVLSAALRNRGNAVVAYPALELTLTNTQDQTVARRIFLPGDYLPDGTVPDRGMGALAAVDVRLELDTGDMRPAGYRLFLFYP